MCSVCLMLPMALTTLNAAIASEQGTTGVHGQGRGTATSKEQPAYFITQRVVTEGPVRADGPGPQEAAPAVREIEGVLVNWAQAWSRKDVDQYLSFYVADYVPPAGGTHGDWRTIRAARLRKVDDIHITLTEPSVELASSTATVRVLQRYQSGALDLLTFKTLVMVKTVTGWKIFSETVGMEQAANVAGGVHETRSRPANTLALGAVQRKGMKRPARHTFAPIGTVHSARHPALPPVRIMQTTRKGTYAKSIRKGMLTSMR